MRKFFEDALKRNGYKFHRQDGNLHYYRKGDIEFQMGVFDNNVSIESESNGVYVDWDLGNWIVSYDWPDFLDIVGDPDVEKDIEDHDTYLDHSWYVEPDDSMMDMVFTIAETDWNDIA